ncbi:S8 family peptidase [Actinokineospora guangxiensis]|uniref:S8 family peptidase n=1 Tax=Actinokineospora guangxiensis TaxID=1490288 RepID=A0ABW0EY30_9PSEU
MGAAAAALLAAAGVSTPASAGEGVILRANQADSVSGAYLVMFKDSSVASAQTSAKASDLARKFAGRITYTYQALNGFAVNLTEAQAKKLAADPAVEYVEQDRRVRALDTQTNPTWGLDRIDQPSLPVDRSYTYPASAGQGVNVYVIDTGILTTHSQFSGGRAKHAYDAIDGDTNATDCNGHGTHVAGTIAGSTYGVAKKATVHAVRVLKCDGWSQGNSVAAGMDWVARNAVLPAVANMSLGGGASQVNDDAARALLARGVTTAVAAGNEGQDACNVSPARVSEVLTVAASNSSDGRSIFANGSSNYGTCVDLFAPGSNITSAWHTGTSATNSISGTSMATPHVAGVAALYLGVSGNSGKRPAEVNQALLNNTVANKISDLRGSPNKLLQIGFLNGGNPDPDPDPEPEPGDCSGPSYTGTLNAGASVWQPNNSHYQTNSTGVHRGCLTGPAGADFDLYLAKWNGSGWVNVAVGETPAANEKVEYTGTAGYYSWRVYAYRGSGSYTLKTDKP